jgi:hypothetical protein
MTSAAHSIEAAGGPLARIPSHQCKSAPRRCVHGAQTHHCWLLQAARVHDMSLCHCRRPNASERGIAWAPARRQRRVLGIAASHGWCARLQFWGTTAHNQTSATSVGVSELSQGLYGLDWSWSVCGAYRLHPSTARRGHGVHRFRSRLQFLKHSGVLVSAASIHWPRLHGPDGPHGPVSSRPLPCPSRVLLCDAALCCMCLTIYGIPTYYVVEHRQSMAKSIPVMLLHSHMRHQ